MAPLSWSARRRWSAGVLALAVAALGALIISATGDGLVYYRTPTEVVGTADRGTVRVAGMVVTGTLTTDDELSEFVMTDGATDLAVRYDGRLPDLVQEGEGVVVEGARGADGAVLATEVLLRHSNEYGPAKADGP